MNEYFKVGIAFGELIGSFVLTLGVLLATTVMKRKTFGLTTKWNQKIFFVITIFTTVVIAITTAIGFGSSGAINPAIALMVAVYKQDFKILGTELVFEFVGGLLAAIVYLIFVKLFNASKAHEEKIEIKNIFKYNTQNLKKGFSMEMLANFFWLLPIMGFVMLTNNSPNLTSTNGFLIAIVAGFAIMTTLFVTTEIGIANLNPQIWLGELVLKLSSRKGQINKKELISELTGVFSVLFVGLLWGTMGYGINYLK